MRVIGLDITGCSPKRRRSRTTLVRLGRIDLKRDRLARFAGSLTSNDHVVIEATGNAAVAEVLRPRRPCDRRQPQTGAPDRARQDQDRQDRRGRSGAALCQVASCPRSDPDERTLALRRQVTAATSSSGNGAGSRTPCSRSYRRTWPRRVRRLTLFGPKGRVGLSSRNYPRMSVLRSSGRCGRMINLSDDLRVVERDLARHALADQNSKRLMTIPASTWWSRSGCWPRSATSALRATSALGRLPGLNPSVRQSGPGPVYHGRITNKAVAMLVACWLRPPGRRQGRLVRCAPSSCGSARRGQHVAAVATARKLAVIVWHLLRRQEDYARGPSGAAHQEDP